MWVSIGLAKVELPNAQVAEKNINLWLRQWQNRVRYVIPPREEWVGPTHLVRARAEIWVIYSYYWGGKSLAYGPQWPPTDPDGPQSLFENVCDNLLIEVKEFLEIVWLPSNPL